MAKTSAAIVAELRAELAAERSGKAVEGHDTKNKKELVKEKRAGRPKPTPRQKPSWQLQTDIDAIKIALIRKREAELRTIRVDGESPRQSRMAKCAMKGKLLSSQRRSGWMRTVKTARRPSRESQSPSV